MGALLNEATHPDGGLLTRTGRRLSSRKENQAPEAGGGAGTGGLARVSQGPPPWATTPGNRPLHLPAGRSQTCYQTKVLRPNSQQAKIVCLQDAVGEQDRRPDLKSPRETPGAGLHGGQEQGGWAGRAGDWEQLGALPRRWSWATPSFSQGHRLTCQPGPSLGQAWGDPEGGCT